METKEIKLEELHLNTGQVNGLPKNPRFIRNERFEALKKSIKDDPEMLKLRELVAYDNNGELVVIMGNMRLRAMRDLKFKTAPVKILPHDTPAKKLRAFAIKDNVPFGQDDFDLLANEWDANELNDWGMNIWEDKQIHTEEGGAAAPTGAAPAIPQISDAPIDPNTLPPELQGVSLEADNLPKIEGDDKTTMERVIIVYKPEQAATIAKMLGLEKIDKVVYDLDEITGAKE